MRNGILNIISLVEPFCLTSPSTFNQSSKSSGSGTVARDSTELIGVKVSRPFATVHGRPLDTNVVHGLGLRNIPSFLGYNNSQLNLMVQRLKWVRDFDGASVFQVRRRRFEEQHRLLGDGVAELFGVGDLVSADSDDLGACLHKPACHVLLCFHFDDDNVKLELSAVVLFTSF